MTYENFDSEVALGVEVPTEFGSCDLLEKDSEQSVENEVKNPVPDDEKTKQRRSWNFFKKRTNQGSSTSLNSRKSMLTVPRRRFRKAKSGSKAAIVPIVFESTEARIELLQKDKSATSDDFRSRMGNRVRSNSSYNAGTAKRKRKITRKKREAELKRKQNLSTQMRTLLDNLCSALSEQDKELFQTLFTENTPQICHPVGILKENDIDRYFDKFVSVYNEIEPVLDIGSVILDMNLFGAHCEVMVNSQYSTDKDSAKFKEIQHWHFDFDIIPCTIPVSFENYEEKTRDSLAKSKDTDTQDDILLFEVKIQRWHVYSSLSKYKKLNSRTMNDIYNTTTSWYSQTRQYGTSYLTNHLYDAFSTENIPPELEQFLKALNNYSPEALEKCFSTKLRAVVVEGLFSFYTQVEKNQRADTNEIVQILLKNFDRNRIQRIKCQSVFRCGKRISARLVLNRKRELIPGFLLLRLSGERKNKANNKVVEMLFCTPSQ